MNVLFMGTDEIGAIALRKVAESSHEIILVISQPDRPKGRGRNIIPGQVKIAAMELGIPILQPDSIRTHEVVQTIKGSSCDIIVVASFGEYIPSKIHEFPPHGAINLHPSLLPRWRGASPVRYTLLAGDEKAGVTIQYVHKRMDAGDIILQEEIPVDPDDDHGSLCDKLYPLGADLLMKALDSIEAGKINPYPQDESKVTNAPKIEKEHLKIDWTHPASELRNKIRAFSPDPGARTRFRHQDYKILASEYDFHRIHEGVQPGTIYELSDTGLVVECFESGLILTKLQPPGKNPITGRDYINGYRVTVGEKFDSLVGGDN